jgi:GDP-L-fucose synthase
MIAHLTRFEGQVVWDPSYPDGQPRRKLNVDRAKREFGFVAEVGFEDWVQETIDWYEASGRAMLA